MQKLIMLNSFKEKRILLLATNNDDSFIFLSCLYEGGYRNIIIVGPGEENRTTKFFPTCRKFYAFPEGIGYKNSTDKLLEFLSWICSTERIDIIFPTGFDSQKFISLEHEAINKMTKVIPAPRPETIALLNNKYTFSNFCYKNAIPHPKTLLLERLDQIFEIRKRMSFPVLTKPLSMSSGKGILKFGREGDLEVYLKNADKSALNELPLLIQEFIPGEDIDFNGFAINGSLKAWTIQKFLDVPFHDRRLRWYQFIGQEEVHRIGQKVVEASCYTGAIHIDLRYDVREKSYTTIEVNPRFWASTFNSIIDGINFADVAIQAAFNRDFLSVQPRCSRRIWGSPHHLPFFLLRYHNRIVLHYALKHTFLQVRYIVRSFFIKSRAKLLQMILRITKSDEQQGHRK